MVTHKHNNKKTCVPGCKWDTQQQLCIYQRKQSDGSDKFKKCGAAPITYASSIDQIKQQMYNTKETCVSPCQWQSNLCSYKRQDKQGQLKYKLCGSPSTSYVSS